jgi:hypothetical protein
MKLIKNKTELKKRANSYLNHFNNLMRAGDIDLTGEQWDKLVLYKDSVEFFVDIDNERANYELNQMDLYHYKLASL